MRCVVLHAHSKLVTGIAERLGKTREQVFYRFVQSQGITPLSGTTSLQHMRDDLEVGEAAVPLTEEEIEGIKKLL